MDRKYLMGFRVKTPFSNFSGVVRTMPQSNNQTNDQSVPQKQFSCRQSNCSTHTIVMISPGPRLTPCSCAIHKAHTPSYSAVPSMLTVAPSGRTKRLIRLSMWLYCSTHFMVVGKVAALYKELKRKKSCLVDNVVSSLEL